MKQLLFDFTNSKDMAGWNSVDDVVMGGVSASTIQWLEKRCLSFRGNVSLEDSGGFASIRSPDKEYKLKSTRGIGLHVMGDGKSYKMTVRTDSSYDGVAYQAPFSTSAGEWKELFFPYNQFVPTYHGQVLTGRPPLDPALIRRFGFIISEQQAGAFQLNIASIWAIT